MNRKNRISIVDPLPEKNEVEFCLNCNDMDDLAVDPVSQDIDAAKERFQNCDETGNFQGDVCSRLYVLSASEEPGSLIDEE